MRERGEGHTGVDGGVDLHPPRYIAVPTAPVVGRAGVAVGGVVDEEMGLGDLVGVVDPSGFDRLRDELRVGAGFGDVGSQDGGLEEGEVGVALRVGFVEGIGG